MKWIRASEIDLDTLVRPVLAKRVDDETVMGRGRFQLSDGTFFWFEFGFVPVLIKDHNKILILLDESAQDTPHTNVEEGVEIPIPEKIMQWIKEFTGENSYSPNVNSSDYGWIMKKYDWCTEIAIAMYHKMKEEDESGYNLHGAMEMQKFQTQEIAHLRDQLTEATRQLEYSREEVKRANANVEALTEQFQAAQEVGNKRSTE